MKKKFLVSMVFFAIPFVCGAQIWITEISYDPEGSDTGFEWIEIFNGGSTDVDVTEYVLRENATNHGIKQVDDTSMLQAGSYAVVADNADKFKSAYPGYSGILFDSAFSLKNTGELLEIKNDNDEVVFEVTYSPDTGGSNNGYSIGLVGDVWFETYQSPGVVNQRHIQEVVTDDTDTQDENNTDDTNVETPTTPTEEVPATYIEIKNPQYETKMIRVDSGGDRTVMAGVGYWFQGEVYGLQGGILDDPEVRWNWGDGTRGSGNPEEHRYLYEGVYTASMSAVSGKYSARDMFTVHVVPPSLSIGSLEVKDNAMYLVNDSLYTLEISGYEIHHGDYVFVFPEDSFITRSSTLVIPYETHLMTLDTNQDTILEDGQNRVVDVFTAQDYLEAELEKQITTKQSAVQVSSTTPIKKATPPQLNVDQYNPTHSVVYVGAKEVEFVGTDENNQEAQSTPYSDNKTQQASVITALPYQEGYWFEVIILCVLSLTALVGYVAYTRVYKKEDTDTYTIIE